MTSKSSQKILLGCVAENNDKFLSQALRLVRSVRWFGGLLEDADIAVCAIEGIEPSYRRALESLGARIRIVPRFDPANPLFNKIQVFRLPEVEHYDTLLYLDCDTIVVQDPSQFLTSSALRIKIADVPTVPTEALERVCGYFGLTPPERSYRTTMDQSETIWYCNAGIVSCPVRFIPRLIPRWCEYELTFSANPDLLGAHQHHRSQAALALAFIEDPVPFEELPVGMNFPLHLTHIEPPPVVIDTDPVILHYHHLVDSAGYLSPSPYPLAQKRIEDFNTRLRAVELRGHDKSMSEVLNVSTDPAIGKPVIGKPAIGKEEEVISFVDTELGEFEFADARVFGKLNDDHPTPRVSRDPVVVCVAGMHRSGTSMVARMIHTCGVYFGPERLLAQSFPDNEGGFWENVDFVELNDALLQEFGGSWDKPPSRENWKNDGMNPLRARAISLIERLSDLKQWGWKDPRSSLTLRFWKQLIPNLKVVICLRNPLEVIQSLVRRGSSADDSLLELWLTYNQELMAAIPPEDRLITHYTSYFLDAHRELRRVLRFLGISASDQTVELACGTVSDALHHQVATEELEEIGIPHGVMEAYLAMCDEAGPVFRQAQESGARESNERRSDYRHILRLTKLEAEIDEKESLFRAREAEIEKGEMHLSTREADIVWLQDEVAALRLRLAATQADLNKGEMHLSTREADIAWLQDEVAALRLRLAATQAELNKVTNTLGWRILSYYGRFKYRFLLPVYRFFRSQISRQKTHTPKATSKKRT